MNRHKLLWSIGRGRVANIPFSDIINLAEGLGFRVERIAGSHHILRHDRLVTKLNLQPVGGQAKPYQVRQLLRLVERYNLTLED